MIAAATENVYMVQFLGFVAERVRDSILASGNKRSSDDVAQVTMGEHKLILDAIEKRDAKAAQAAMRAHLDGAARRVGALAPDAGLTPAHPDLTPPRLASPKRATRKTQLAGASK